MSTMKELGIQEVLTNDRHFEQEGFVVLMKHPA
jgi:predicted nucleic acid-binding protein